MCHLQKPKIKILLVEKFSWGCFSFMTLPMGCDTAIRSVLMLKGPSWPTLNVLEREVRMCEIVRAQKCGRPSLNYITGLVSTGHLLHKKEFHVSSSGQTWCHWQTSMTNDNHKNRWRKYNCISWTFLQGGWDEATFCLEHGNWIIFGLHILHP